MKKIISDALNRA